MSQELRPEGFPSAGSDRSSHLSSTILYTFEIAAWGDLSIRSVPADVPIVTVSPRAAD